MDAAHQYEIVCPSCGITYKSCAKRKEHLVVGLPHVTFHTMRRYFASATAQPPSPIILVQGRWCMQIHRAETERCVVQTKYVYTPLYNMMRVWYDIYCLECFLFLAKPLQPKHTCPVAPPLLYKKPRCLLCTQPANKLNATFSALHRSGYSKIAIAIIIWHEACTRLAVVTSPTRTIGDVTLVRADALSLACTTGTYRYILRSRL